jgi:hypothetical protein
VATPLVLSVAVPIVYLRYASPGEGNRASGRQGPDVITVTVQSAGAALVESAGGFVSPLEKPTANRRDPLLSGLLAGGPFLKNKLLALVEPHIRARGSPFEHFFTLLAKNGMG